MGKSGSILVFEEGYGLTTFLSTVVTTSDRKLSLIHTLAIASPHKVELEWLKKASAVIHFSIYYEYILSMRSLTSKISSIVEFEYSPSMFPQASNTV